MISGLDIGLDIGVYDGDTSKENRKLIRDGARLVCGHRYYLKYLSIILYFFCKLLHHIICS